MYISPHRVTLLLVFLPNQTSVASNDDRIKTIKPMYLNSLGCTFSIILAWITYTLCLTCLTVFSFCCVVQFQSTLLFYSIIFCVIVFTCQIQGHSKGPVLYVL